MQARIAELERRIAPIEALSHHSAVDADGVPLWKSSCELAKLSSSLAFRSDCAYLWQSRGDRSGFEAALQAAYDLIRARPSALSVLSAQPPEDAAFGAETVLAADGVRLSRDLLDAANEMAFLDEELQISTWSAGATLVDVGAGYGRLAHRLAHWLPRLRVISTDAVPTSLAFAEHYLRHRGLEAAAADVLPPDTALSRALDGLTTPPALAIAIHSLPEMSREARGWWARLFFRRGVMHFFVVTNAAALADGDSALQLCADDGSPLIAELRAAGYRLRRAAWKYDRRGGSTRGPQVQPESLPHADCHYCLFERCEQPMLAPARVRTSLALTINLRSRADRREWMEATALAPLAELGVEAALLPALAAADVAPMPRAEPAEWPAGWALDREGLDRLAHRWAELGLAPVQAEELALYHARPVSAAEAACHASHRDAWRRGAEAHVDLLLVLEDDVTPFADAPRPRARREFARAWARLWLTLQAEVDRLEGWGEPWDILLLGRNRLGADGAAIGEKLVEPGFSSCAHAYALSRRGLAKLLALPAELARSIPVDDLLPALWAEHPRTDVASWCAAAPGRLRCLAFRPALLEQLESVSLGAADEVLCERGAEGDARLSATASQLSASDIRPRSAARIRPRGRAVPRPAAPAFLGPSLGPSRGALGAEHSAPGLFEHGWPEAELLGHSAPGRRRSTRAERVPAPCFTPLPAYAWLVAAMHGGVDCLRSLRLVARGLRTLLDDQSAWRSLYARRRHAIAMAAASGAGQPAAVACEVEAWLGFVRSWRSTCLAAFACTAEVAGGGAAKNAPSPPLAPPLAPPPSSDTPLSSSLRCVPTEPEASLAPASFRRRFETPRLPVMVRHGVGSLMSQPARWTIEGLLSAYAQRSFPVLAQGTTHDPSMCRMRLLDFAAYVQAQHPQHPASVAAPPRLHPAPDADPLYLFEPSIPPELWPDFRPPPHFENDLLDEAVAWHARHAGDGGDDQGGGGDEATDLLSERRWLVVGPPRSGCRWHVDPFGTSAWNACLSGRKLWCLMPPADTTGLGPAGGAPYPPDVERDDGEAGRCGVHVLAPPAAEWFGRWAADSGAHPAARSLMWAEQRPGDVLFVPAGWWHTTLNVETTVALTQNVLPPGGAAAALRELSAAPGQERAARLLRAVLEERHSDG